MIDQIGNSKIMESVKKIQDAIQKGDYGKATNGWSLTENLVNEVVGGVDFYNIITKEGNRHVKGTLS